MLIVDPSGLLWGSERALLDLLRHVDASRYDVTVLSPASTQLASHLTTLGIRVIEGPIGMLHRRSLAARIKALAWLAMAIRRYRPDVIHVNEAGATTLVSAARLGRRTPVIAHVRLWDDAVVLASGLPRFAAPRLSIAISRFIADRLRRARNDNGQSNITVSARSSNRIHDVRVVYDPFDASAFAAEALTSPDRDVVAPDTDKATRTVLMVGRICHEKGQHLLLDAAERLKDESVTYLFVGGVPPDSPRETAYHEALLERARAPEIRDRVRFLGNRADVAALMSASDLVVLASANEPFGRVLLEALSLGIPVVAPDRGGPAEIIGDGERGSLFRTGSGESLAVAIREALTSPFASAERASRGRDWVLRECSPSMHATRIQQLWDEAASAAARSA